MEYGIFWCHRFLESREEGQEELEKAYFISKYNSVKRSALKEKAAAKDLFVHGLVISLGLTDIQN